MDVHSPSSLVLVLLLIVAQLIATILVFTPNGENLAWVTREDSCDLEPGFILVGTPSLDSFKVETQFYSYRFCADIDEDSSSRDCNDYSDDEVENINYKDEAEDAYPAAMALAALNCLLMTIEIIALVCTLSFAWCNCCSCVAATFCNHRNPSFRNTFASLSWFMAVTSIVIVFVATVNESTRNELDLYPSEAVDCGDGPDDLRLGYGAALHVVLTFFFALEGLFFAIPLFKEDAFTEVPKDQPTDAEGVTTTEHKEGSSV